MDRPITNSERSSFTCQQRWLWQYGFRFRPQVEARPLYSGDVLHKALDVYWDGGASHASMLDAQEIVYTGYSALMSRSSEPGVFDPSATVEEDKDELMEQCSAAMGMISRYHEHWSSRRSWEIICTEVELCAEVEGHKIAGKVDKVVRDDKGRVLIVDHKTTRLPIDRWKSLHQYSPQLLTYAFLVRDQLDIVPNGLVFDVLHNKRPLHSSEIKRLKDGSVAKYTPSRLPSTTSDQWLEAIKDDDKEHHDAVTKALEQRERNGYWFAEHLELFTAEDIERVSIELATIAQDISFKHDIIDPYLDSDEHVAEVVKRAAYEVGPSFPRNHKECFAFNRPCPYMSLCRYGELDEGRFIQLDSAHAELDDANGEETDE